MSELRNVKTARVDLLDDRASILLTIGDDDKTETKFRLSNDAASQLVSMMLMVAGHAPSTPEQTIQVKQPIPTSNAGWGKNDITGQTVLVMVVGQFNLSFLVDPAILLKMSRDIVAQTGELTGRSTMAKN